MRRVHQALVYIMLCVSLLVSVSLAGDTGQPPPATQPSSPQTSPPDTGDTRGVGIVPKLPAQAPTVLGKYHAVLIGINDYTEMPRLKTPIGDVEELGKILKEEYGFEEVVLITDKTPTKPTAKNIVNTLRDKAKSLTEQDNLLVYFAGHGEQDKLIDESYWIPIEGKKDDTTTWIPHTSIRSLLETNNIKIKNFLLVADSCYSGNLTRGTTTGDEVGEKDPHARINKLLAMAARKSREVITSGSNEPVQDAVKGSQHSLFAHYMLKALEENTDKYTDFASLFNQRIKPDVEKFGLQYPDRSRVRSAVDDKGVFVLAKVNAKDLPPKIDKDALIVDLTKKLNSALDKIKELSEKNKSSEQELTKISKDLEGKNREKAELESALKDSKLQLTAERNRLESERTAILQQQSQLVQKVKQLESEEARIKANGTLLTSAEIEKISREKTKLEADMKALKDKERFQENNFRELRNNEDLYAKRLETLQEKERGLTALEDRYRQREQELKSKDQEVALLHEQISSLNHTINDLRGIIASAATGAKPPIDPTGSGRFLVSDSVVIDTRTNLMWVKQATSTTGKTYDEAEKYVDELIFGNYSGWRLPTSTELEKLIGKEKGLDKSYPEGHPFTEVMPNFYYWSASAVNQRPKVFNASTGNSTNFKKNSINYVWPVRDASPEEIAKARSLKDTAHSGQ